MTDNHRTLGQQNNHSQALVAILVDIENVYLKPKQAELLLRTAKSKGRLICSTLFYNSRRKNQVVTIDNLKKRGFKCVDVRDSSKNSADKALVFYCTKLFAVKPSPDIIVLVLGDRDFAGLITMLLQMGKQVIIFARRKSTTPKIINLVGEENFHDVEELSSLCKKGKEQLKNQKKLPVTAGKISA